MKTALVTGANRGLGLQTAIELAGKGYKVFAGTRDRGKHGKTAEQVGENSNWITVDAADTVSIANAARQFAKEEKSLDILVNNAGIYPDEGLTLSTISREQMVETFQTNTFGALEVAQAFLPFLRKSKEARIINVSSGYGELDGISYSVPSYCLSKLALNGVTIMLADELKSDGIAVNSVCPGWVRTDMGGSSATRSIEEGAAGIVWLASEAPHKLTGKFFRDGEEIDW